MNDKQIELLKQIRHNEKVVIHLGMHKTGTSTLQKCLFPHLKGTNYVGRPYQNTVKLDDRPILLSDETIFGRLFDAY